MFSAFEIPVLRFSLVANADVEPKRFLTVVADAETEVAVVQHATDTSSVIGMSKNFSAATHICEIYDGIAMVETAVDVTSGEIAYSDANGRCTNIGTIPVGIILHTAAAGGYTAVKMYLAAPSA